MASTLFIIWRESVEAMLVIGILYGWLRKNAGAGQGMWYLWGGVGAGIGLALLLAGAMMAVHSELSGQALEYFQIAMVFLASALITQMVLWMRKNGRTLGRELQEGAAKAADSANWLGISVLAAIAVGREGMETVVFLYGVALEQHGLALLQFILASGAGFALALLTFWLLAAGSRYLSWRIFFRVSEIMLLVLGAGLLLDGFEKLVGIGWVPSGIDPVWDTSFLLDDNTIAGNLLAALTGYRARPALALVLAYLAYWTVVTLLIRKPWQQAH